MRYLPPLLISGIVAGLMTASALAGTSPPPQVKILTVPADPTQETVLVGRTIVDDMVVQLELEPAKQMWMLMDNAWGEHPLGPGELYHVEVKPIDPKSNSRISNAEIVFRAIKLDNYQRTDLLLHPMWGGSGLHYALNSGLSGDGTYEGIVIVGVPTFVRELKDKSRWMEPAIATFHFKLADGKLVEVSEPIEEVAAR